MTLIELLGGLLHAPLDKASVARFLVWAFVVAVVALMILRSLWQGSRLLGSIDRALDDIDETRDTDAPQGRRGPGG